MLILSRRPGESTLATAPDGSVIEFTVLGIKGNQVRIGVSAEKNVNIVRKELLDPDRVDAQLAKMLNEQGNLLEKAG